MGWQDSANQGNGNSGPSWLAAILLGCGLPVFLVAAGCVFMVANSSHQPTNSTVPEPVNAKDDLDLFLKRFGAPDVDTSSLHERPRPQIVTRFLTYKKEKVKVVYFMGNDGSWKFMSFIDPKTNKVVRPAEAVARLKDRDRGVPR